MKFGECLRYVRKAKEMSQTDLAKKLNVSVANISQYERGLRIPKISQVQKFADALDVQAIDLLTDPFSVESFRAMYNLEDEQTLEEVLTFGAHALVNKALRQLTNKLFCIDAKIEMDQGLHFIVDPDCSIEMLEEELLELNKRCNNFLAFELNSFKQEHPERIIKKEPA